MSTPSNQKTGVVLMTYGSATTAENVPAYFESIYKGKASAEVIADFTERYRIVGGSPLVRITTEQAALLEKRLGQDYVVRAGMRHSAPTIDEAIAQCRSEGATRLIGIILSPQFSSYIMEGYRTAFATSAQVHGFADGNAVVAGPWPNEEHFISLLAERVQKSMAELRSIYGRDIPIVFTTHSLPQRVVETDPQYLTQIAATIEAVRAKIGPGISTYAGYQSAGHTPEAWLNPDLTDILSEIAQEKSPAVLIVPIQFLADHLEILYDLDVAGREQCVERGIDYHRIELPNSHPLFIESLAATTHACLFSLAS